MADEKKTDERTKEQKDADWTTADGNNIAAGGGIR